jgi:serine/threonine protein kinase
MSSQRFPRMFGKYALLRPFARGGMGEIYLAASGEVVGAEKLCLVKKVPEDRDAPGLTARLLDEAKVAVRLNHTNLVQVFDAGKVDDELYIAMELIEGRDLRAVWNRTAERRSRIPLDVALYIVREIARGLDFAHNYGGLGLVHRDIAPPNILISFHGEVKVTDFGLARSILKNERTAPGIVYGRIAYLAPEQARGEQADARTDIFATGVILWELLTGRPLHDTGDDAVKNLDQARHPQIQAPSHLTRGLPSSVDAVSLKALATEREQRYQTADELRKAVADELARIAPGTDSSRVSAFLKDLFGDEVKKEQAERERLLREDLPKVRAQRVAPPPPRAQIAAAPAPQPMQQASSLPQHDDEDLGDSFDPPTRRMAKPELPLRAPPPLPGVRGNNGNGAPLPGMKAPPAPSSLDNRAPSPPPIRSMLRGVPSDRGRPEPDEDERTMTAPPRGIALTPPGPRAAAARAPAPQPYPRSDSGELPAPEALIGLVVDNRYRIERVLGTGGMGAVYEAEHIEIGKKVALKVLHPQFSRQADLVARFRREARAASKVGHPNIVDVTDSGTTPDGDVYFIMERLDGLDLGEVLRHERRVAPDRTVAIGTQICRALSAAHAAGIIHRDLKPENVFLVSREGVPDFVKVLDFGIAKQDMGNQNSPRRLTTPGIAMGTPEYMAPEQAAGKAIDGRVDIYSVGAILYEMLTGEPPHHGNSAMEVLAKKATEAPTPPHQLNPEVPESLEEVVMRCLEREPDRRPQTMGALEYELTKSMKGRGSAVAAALGIKSSSEDGISSAGWGDESSKPRLFEAATIQQRRSSMPSIPVQRSGATGATPLAMDDGDKIRVNSSRIASRDAVAETLPMTEQQNAELREARRAGRWQKRLGFVFGMLFLGLAGLAAYWIQSHGIKPPIVPKTDTLKPDGTKSDVPPTTRTAPATTGTTPPPVVAVKPKDEPNKADVEPLLEWARRCAEAGRIVSPPKDNLKELLDRIDKVDPGNPQAEALKTRTTQLLSRKGLLSLKKGRLDEAEEDFQTLVVLKPDDDAAKQRLARTLTMRSQRALGAKKQQAALADAQAALELAPDDTNTAMQLADVHLAMGKHELAAEEYQRVLDVKPLDKRAKAGLLKASAPKPKATKKKRGR